MTDQQRYDALAVNGNPAIRTPSLDRLAHEGVRFTHSFCAASACKPSRASLLTGVYPNIHGVTRTTHAGPWVNPSLPTLPGLLTSAGYRTVSVGKMHFEPWDSLCGLQRRVFIESKYFTDLDEYRLHLRRRGLEDQFIGHHVPGFGRANKAMASPLDPDDHIDGFIGRRAIEILDQLADDESSPFFLWVSFCGPHDPYDPPGEYARMYRPQDMPLPHRAPDELGRVPPIVKQQTTAFGVEKMNLHGHSDAEMQRVRAHYYGNVSLIDDRIGCLLERLEQRGLSQQTVVVFTSDHGDYLGDHDLQWKTYLPSDADMRVPFLLRWPGRCKPGVNEGFVSGLDVMPTLLRAGDTDIPNHLQGLDLMAILEGRLEARRSLVMFSEPDRWRYRDRHWAYTRWPDQPFDTLYDLSLDPWEENNLCYGDATPSDVVERLRREIGYFSCPSGSLS